MNKVKYEISCGAVVFSISNNQIKYVIVESLEGFYGFPKGHIENYETEIDTALREIKEETGLDVEVIPGFRYVSEHPLPSKKDVIKRVIYFLAQYSNQDIVFSKEELKSARLMEYEEAIKCFQFENTKDILKSARDFIESQLLIK